ncbi:MAG: peptidase E [Gammaproteobacteria bacterium]|nr:peptidase E [Gammaproteobacteria bacterium]
MGTIVAIGGGSIRNRETEPIDREIIRLTGKSQPRALFVPTASGDSARYCRQFQHAYGDTYGCFTDELLLLGSAPDATLVRDKIACADIVYVGGGNTLKMMRRWRRLGVDGLLRKAFDRGAVFCGVSAGAICWFERGHSDSMAYYDSERWDYIAVTGLGLVKGMACPHYNGRTYNVPRRRDFRAMMRRKGGCGLGIDNHCAVVFSDVGYRVLKTKERSGAHALWIQGGELMERKLATTAEYLPIESMFESVGR